MSDWGATAPLPAAPAAVGGRISLPDGARCAVQTATTHVDADATFACSRCGTFGCAACLFGGAPPPGVVRLEVCRACAQGGLDEPIPWERRKELGWWRAFADTTNLVNLQPTRFFRTPSIEKGALGGLMYGAAAYAAGQLVLMIVMGVTMMLGGAVAGALTQEPVIAGVLAGYGCFFIGLSPFILAQAPVQALFGMIIGGGAAHGSLMLMKRSKVKFEDTLRVIGYAYAPHVWVGIPACGGIISYVWMLVAEFKAIRETHKCGNDGAAVAVFGYRVLLFVLLIGFYAVMVGMMVLYMPGPQSPPGGTPFDPPFGSGE